MKKSRYPGVFTDGKDYYTPTTSHHSVYGERVIKRGKLFYRMWTPSRSKLAAAMKLGLRTFPFKDSKVLYLGASTGTTVSHISDIAALVWAVEISPVSVYKLLSLAERRMNIIPLLMDAREVDKLSLFVFEPEVLYQDVSQRDQITIFIRNMMRFKPRYGFLMLKTRTIDMRKAPREILKVARKRIGEMYAVEEIINLSRYQRDHYAIVVKG